MASSSELPVWHLAPFDNPRYVDLSYNEEAPSAIPECVRSKVFNRFMDVLPNPSTRVKLPSDPRDPTAEYINANYVHGFDGTFPAYIAAMGPLPATIDTFWKMVWEHKVTCIIMATGLVEGSKVKCERYWPEEFKEDTYGDIKVEWMAAERQTGYLVTRLQATKGSQSLTINHIWYNTWPDHGVPSRPDGSVYPDDIIGMLSFVHERCKASEHPNSPIVIHCSAGIGRTGAIIAIDHSLQLLTRHRFVDICGVIEYIRMDRCALVQHPNQYELVYQACLRFATQRGQPVELRSTPPPDLPKVEAVKSTDVEPRKKKIIKKLEDHISSDEEEEESPRLSIPELPKSKEETLRRNFLDHVNKAWFHGVMSREQSEELCTAAGMEEGQYLVRESPNTPGQYVVTLVSEGQIYHNRIIYKDEMFRTTRVACPTVAAVLLHYSVPRDDFQTALLLPIECRRSRALSVISSLNERELDLIALPTNAVERAQLPEKLSKLETRRAGWLMKQGGGRDQGSSGAFTISGKTGGLFARKNWKRRYFVLQDTIIKYYKTETETGLEEALGYINLSGDSTVEVMTDRSFAIHTMKRVYFMYSDSVEVSRDWVETLENAIRKIQGSSV